MTPLVNVLLGIAVAYVFIVALAVLLWYDLVRKRKSREIELLENVLKELRTMRSDLLFLRRDLNVMHDDLHQANVKLDVLLVLSEGKKPRTITLTGTQTA